MIEHLFFQTTKFSIPVHSIPSLQKPAEQSHKQNTFQAQVWNQLF